MSEFAAKHNQDPLPPVVEHLKGKEVELANAMQVPEDFVMNKVPEGTELLGIASMGLKAEEGGDQIAVLRLPSSEHVLAGVTTETYAQRGTRRYLGAISGPLQEGQQILFGRRGDNDPGSGVIGAAALFMNPSAKFGMHASSIHMGVRMENGVPHLKDGLRGASTNGTWLEYASQPDEAQPVAPVTRESVERPKTRAQILFAPVETQEVSRFSDAEYEAQYKAMLDGTGPEEVDVERAAVRTNEGGRNQVTQESVDEAARSVLMAENVDDNVRGILQHFAPGAPSKQRSELIRTNADLRLALGEYLTIKYDTLRYLPSNVARRHPKSPNRAGYRELGNISSKEYVVLLALSKLDGTFISDQQDAITYSPSTPNGVGQHRYTADELLARGVEND